MIPNPYIVIFLLKSAKTQSLPELLPRAIEVDILLHWQWVYNHREIGYVHNMDSITNDAFDKQVNCYYYKVL